VSRHQAGRSSRTDNSVERISSNWPGVSGSICLRISSSRPLPQSRSPPSKLASGAYGWRALGFLGLLVTRILRSIRDAGRAAGEKLDQLGAADDLCASNQIILVEAAPLEAGRADIDGAAGGSEIRHQFF